MRERRKMSNLTVEKANRHSLTRLIKFDIIRHDRKYLWYDVMAMALHLSGNPPQTHDLSLTFRKTKQPNLDPRIVPRERNTL